MNFKKTLTAEQQGINLCFELSMKQRHLSLLALIRRVWAVGWFLLCAFLLNPEGVRAETLPNWTKYDNTIPANSNTTNINGRIGLATSGTKGDVSSIISACAIKDDATYKMWYTGYDGANYRIYYATSSNGLEWTKYDNGIPDNSDGSSTNGKIPRGTAGKGDATHTGYPWVIKDGSTYKMWYCGNSGSWRIYYATSSNGLEWTKYDNTTPDNSDGSSTNGKIPRGTAGRGDADQVSTPQVIKDGSTYKMWYVASDGANYRVYYATSSNGLEWTKYDNTIPANSDGSSTNGKIPLGTSGKGDELHILGTSVLKDNINYKMWYTGRTPGNTDRVYYATSPDGLTWTKYDNTIPPNSDTINSNSRIGLGTAGRGDDLRVRNPFVLQDASSNTVFKMWYVGNDGAFERIYYAIVPPPPAGTIFTFK